MASEAEIEVLKKLERAPEGEPVTFNAEQVRILKIFARVGLGLESVIWMSTGVRNVLMWAGGMYLAYVAFFDWAMKAMGKK